MPGWADSITVNGKTYTDVHIKESEQRYYFRGQDGHAISVKKSEVKPDDLHLQQSEHRTTVPATLDNKPETPPHASSRGKKDAAQSKTRAPRVLLDMSHEFGFEAGNGICGADGYLRPAGYIVLDLESGLRETIVPAFDVLVLYHRGSPAQYSDKELAVIKSFVERGGGLLFYADAGNVPTAATFPLNRVAREVGIEFLPDVVEHPAPTSTLGISEMLEMNARRIKILDGFTGTTWAHGANGEPVIVSLNYGKGRVAAISGEEFFTNPAGRAPLKNQIFIQHIFKWLSSWLTADTSVDVEFMQKTRGTRIDPDRVIQVPGFRILYPDPLPANSIAFLQENLPLIYQQEEQLFGYGIKDEKTVIALMCCGAGWTASNKLVGLGVQGDEIVVASVMIHEISNSLCVETPVWLGDAGWSAYVQIKIKTALGGKFAESVRGELEKRIQDYQSWEQVNGPYDLTKETNHHIGGGKVMAILSALEQKYGKDVMKRYFAAAKQWKDHADVKNTPIVDRVVFYFSKATGEDQIPFFRSFGLDAKPILISEK